MFYQGVLILSSWKWNKSGRFVRMKPNFLCEQLLSCDKLPLQGIGKVGDMAVC